MKIILRKKKLKNDKESLYIEFYKGSVITPEGKRKFLRDFEYLDLYIDKSSNSSSVREKNKETLRLAENILSIRQAEHIQGKYQIKNTRKTKTNFLDYYHKLKEERYQSKGNYDNWDAAGLHLQAYCPANISFDEIDENFVKGYRKYLDTKAKTKSGTPLSQNTKYTYYNKFRACIGQAFEDQYGL
ncbi:phage integrase SAM-like domain-containing protein [Zobellia laminariae]|uniref:phage integrase SAM-like domain-containing protein n=1 Tax=Zobellia laminariae TaxID=248906 RepID=UPI0034CFCE92